MKGGKDEADGLMAQAAKVARLTGNGVQASPELKYLAYYQHRLQLPNGRHFSNEEIEWCLKNCKGNFSNDFTCSPFGVSFSERSDMIMFKLTMGVGKPAKRRL